MRVKGSRRLSKALPVTGLVYRQLDGGGSHSSINEPPAAAHTRPSCGGVRSAASNSPISACAKNQHTPHRLKSGPLKALA